MLVDVVMLTKNSAKPYFKKCLISIKAHVPLNKFIVVDAYSMDNTIEIINRFFPNPTIIRTRWPLAQARKLGIQHVETEWFAFIDSDIVLFPGWFKTLSNLMDDNTGGIQGGYQHANAVLLKWSRWQENVWKKKFLHKEHADVSIINRENFLKYKIRGLTHNTLIRTSCVNEWEPPSSLHIGEDHHLFLHIIKRGYSWIVYNKPICLHYAFLDLTETLQRGLTTAREAKRIAKCGCIEPNEMWINPTAKSYLKILTISFVKALLASIYEKDPRILAYKLCLHGAPLLII